MITFPVTLQKGEDLSVSLDKAALFAAITDEYFSVQENVEKVVFIYKSATSNQRKRVEFTVAEASPVDVVKFSEKADDLFNLERIVLIDFDGGCLALVSTIVPSESERSITLGDLIDLSDSFFAFDGDDSTLGGFDTGSFYDDTALGEGV